MVITVSTSLGRGRCPARHWLHIARAGPLRLPALRALACTSLFGVFCFPRVQSFPRNNLFTWQCRNFLITQAPALAFQIWRGGWQNLELIMKSLKESAYCMRNCGREEQKANRVHCSQRRKKGRAAKTKRRACGSLLQAEWVFGLSALLDGEFGNGESDGRDERCVALGENLNESLVLVGLETKNAKHSNGDGESEAAIADHERSERDGCPYAPVSECVFVPR